MENEWDLLLLMRQHLNAGEPPLNFNVLEPLFWTIFSGRTARVIGVDGTLFELGPDFSIMLHEMIKDNIGCSLVYDAEVYDPPKYQLAFFPTSRHPHYDPVRDNLDARPSSGFTSTSPDALRQLLDRLLPPPPRLSDAEGPPDNQ